MNRTATPRSRPAREDALPATPARAAGDPSDVATLYEVARGLLGARDARQVAWRIVYSGLGVLGVRSGAMFVASGRGRFRCLASAGLSAEPHSDALTLSPRVRDWILDAGTFAIAGATAARGLGDVRDRLARDYDAVRGAAVGGPPGLHALLVFGPALMPGVTGPANPGVLESIASLAAQALGAFGDAAGAENDGPPARPARSAARSRPARAFAELRREHRPLERLIGESEQLFEASKELVAVAPTRFPVLLTGESGVGKELAAHAVHAMSDRAKGPFEVIDCGSIPAELIESELFGHVKGAFTGAQRDRRGAFEMAHRGTLFLDEIGEMPFQLQTRLLRAIQESRFRRVGDESLVDVDVRIVAATNRDLLAEVEARRFRQDLFYRLNVFSVLIPALRDRREDIGMLLKHFLELQGREVGVRTWSLEDDVVAALEVYDWPGNIRELVNLCAALVVHVRARGHVTMPDLAHVWRRQYVGQSAPWQSATPVRGHIGDWIIEQARATRFNMVELARILAGQKRAGLSVPVAERSALTYYLTGEILRLLVEHEGDVDGVAAALGGEGTLADRARARAVKVRETLRACAGSDAALRRKFGKLPAEYTDVLAAATALAERG